ncbi:YqzG/YhdC family protein [Alicyclobacillus macrosporangiidus]|uniref:YqzG/YhdC family protein n=1 Tax=Alicyclobacillus macrosporangiidus TaxID=392015 RepID=UPI0022AFA0D2|nr:YqzG/YhdC family protein [Alicyclobacillus macrosporangiidus]
MGGAGPGRTPGPRDPGPRSAASRPRRPAQRPYAKPEPAYAPWGRMAMRIVQNRYPNAAIVDYLHVGRRNLSATQAQETFKLWLRQGKQEFGVYVTITFNPKTQRVLRTDLRRTAR